MASAAEIEVKFRVADVASLTAKLRAAGFRLVTDRTHEFNTIYDFPDLRLRARGELLRLREYGEQWRLTHKGKTSYGKHKSRIETETSLESGKAMQTILLTLGMRPAFRYEKFRSEWSDGAGHVVVDETPIGDLAEIEGTPEWIDHTAAALGVGERDYITSSYAQLFFAWKSETGSHAEEMTWASIGVTVPR